MENPDTSERLIRAIEESRRLREEAERFMAQARNEVDAVNAHLTEFVLLGQCGPRRRHEDEH